MQVFKLFFRIAKAKMPSGLIYVIVFFAVCFPMSRMAIGQTTFEEKQLNVVVFDEDQSEASQALVAHIGKNHKLKELKNDPKLILDAMYYEQVDYTVTIKRGYGENLAKTDEEASKTALFETFHLHDSYATAMMEQYFDQYVRMVRSYIAGGNELSEAIKKTEDKIDVEAEVSIAEFDNGKTADPDYPESFALVFRYLPYVLISVMINVLCPILLVMKKKDQRFRMNCSSTKLSSFSAQIFGGSAVLVLGVWLLFLIGASFMYGGIFRGVNCWIAVGNTLLFALISAVIALLVASFNPSESTLSMITQCVGLGMCFLCGVFVPQSLMGDGVMAVSPFSFR